MTEPPVSFDPLAPGFTEEPYGQYARLRDEDPVHRSPLLHGWVVTRYDDVNLLLRDPTVSSDIGNATPTPLTELEIAQLSEQPRAARTIVLMDDPEHARIRALLAPPFRARGVEVLRQRITTRVDAALDRLLDRHGAGPADLDLVGEFAYPLPVEVFTEMLGLPDEENPRFRYWAQCVARAVDPVISAAERDECLRGLDEMHAYLGEQADERRRHPTDDLLTTLVHGDVNGERIAHEDLVAQLVTLYMAGHEPTASLVAAGALALIRAPDQHARLRADRTLLPNAISEFLRFDGPNHFVRRITTRPTVLAGTELPAGAVVYASPASANRDPRRFGADADALRIDRPDAAQHLQFGAGAHACLGVHLARLQTEIAVTALLDRVAELELVGEPEWGNRMFIRGLTRLPVRCRIVPPSDGASVVPGSC